MRSNAFLLFLSVYIRTLVVHMLPRRSPHHFLSLHLDHSEVRREFRTAWICVQVTYIHVVLEVIFLTSLCIAGRTRFLIAEFVRWPAWQRFYSPLMRMDFNLLYFVQLLSRWYFPSLRRFRYPCRSISAQWLISWLEYLITFWSDWRLKWMLKALAVQNSPGSPNHLLSIHHPFLNHLAS